MEDEAWWRNHGEEMMERSHEGGIMEEGSWRRNHGRRNHGSEIIEESCRRNHEE